MDNLWRPISWGPRALTKADKHIHFKTHTHHTHTHTHTRARARKHIATAAQKFFLQSDNYHSMWWFSTTKWPGNPRNSLRPGILGIHFVQKSSEIPSSRNPRISLRPEILGNPSSRNPRNSLYPEILGIPFVQKSSESISSWNPRDSLLNACATDVNQDTIGIVSGHI